MAFKIKTVNLKERDELEPLLVENPDFIEEGMKIIAHQHPTDTGPLDILAVDSEGILVVIELKNEASENHLDQGIRYYDWCRQNLAWISNAYSKNKINPDILPRLILIAPTFTDNVKKIAKYVDIDLQLYEYHAIQNEKGENGIICSEIDFGEPIEPPQIQTLDKKIEYFQDPKVRELYKSILNELQENGIEIKPINGLWISLWYKNKRFIYTSPKKNFFIFKVLSPDGTWTSRVRINRREEWDSIYKDHVKKYMDFLDSQ